VGDGLANSEQAASSQGSRPSFYNTFESIPDLVLSIIVSSPTHPLNPASSFIMVHSAISRPYITVSLHSTQDLLDLSAQQAFDLEIIATLHADKAVLIYSYETLLSPDAALRHEGIDFNIQGENAIVPRSTVNVCTFGGPIRTWNARKFKILEPGVAKSIRVPFGALEPLASDQFDLRFWWMTSSFKAGNTYEARLPSTTNITWWRTATAAEIKSGAPAPPGSLSVVTNAVASWWSGTRLKNGGVPVLPETEQLPLIVEGNDVTFDCIGIPREIPTSS
jgi:hypothetical protein